MSRYIAERAVLGTQPLVVLRDDAGRRVRIACHGAALIGFEVPRGDAMFDIAFGYRDGAEIESRRGSHFAIMVPFAGRIANARYCFDGREYDLQPGVEGPARGIMHGFLRDADFAVAELAAGESSARVTLGAAIQPRAGYPFTIDVAVAFTLDADGLALEVRMRNAGDAAAPCFFGWHPYLRVNDGAVDGWLLEIRADTLIRTDADMIALEGNAAYVSLDEAPAFDFRQPREIAHSNLDSGYVDAEAGADGRIRTRITDPADGFTVTMWRIAAACTRSRRTRSGTGRGAPSPWNRWKAWRMHSTAPNARARYASKRGPSACFAAASR
jgi:aldose 1-epimerase